jgi:8-oxo-dGTP pyrophosphatase MutT (NUDIX family)
VTARVDIDGVAWPVLGAQVAVIHEGRVLLQFRPFPPGWELPGGHCEDGEDPAITAAREAEEETGYCIEILRLAGVYTWSGLRRVGDVLYVGALSGGGPKRSLEAWSTRFVSPDALPRTLFPWFRRRINDAFAAARDAEPVHRVQPVTAYHVATFATDWMRAPVDALRHRRLRKRMP